MARIQYKFNEEVEPIHKFEVKTLPNGKKDIILRDGTSVSEKYFTNTKRPEHSGIYSIETRSDKGKTVYICKGINNKVMFLVNEDDGGTVFPYKLEYVRWWDVPGKLQVKSSNLSNTYNGEMYSLIDYDFNVIINWCNFLMRGTDDVYIIMTDNGENLFNIKTQKYILKEWFESIDKLSGTDLFKVENKDGEFNIVDENGNFMFKEHSGDPMMVGSIEDISLKYEHDLIGGEDVEISGVIVENGSDYQSIYLYDENVLKKVDVWYGDSVLGKTILDVPKSGFFLITTRYEDQYNYIGNDGKLKFKKWFSSYDTDTLDDIDCMLITRGGKFNIVGNNSLEPLFGEDEWIDDIETIEDPYGNYDTFFAIKRNGKCNIIYPQKKNYIKYLMGKWCDDIMVYEDENGYKFIFVKYEDKTYLCMPGVLIECTSCYKGKGNLIFVRNKEGKWNFTFGGDLEMDEWVDDVYDIDTEFPIIRKGDKYTFITTNDKRIQFTNKEYKTNWRTGRTELESEEIRWFDDVDSVGDSDNLEFTVYENGKKLVLDDYGDEVENEGDGNEDL